MQIAIITIFPEMLSALKMGIPAQAQKKGLLELRTFNPRDYAKGLHRVVDDHSYGGGPGMVMMPEPLWDAIQAAKAWLGDQTKVLYLSPQGRSLTQEAMENFACIDKLILLCGRYEGIDERIIHQCVDEEWSIGDYILSGGELPAFVLVDAISRLIPGVLQHVCSNQQDSFSEGLLDHPHYTRPEIFRDERVPDVLLSGHHARIEEWRRQQRVEQTAKKRPDLLVNRKKNKE